MTPLPSYLFGSRAYHLLPRLSLLPARPHRNVKRGVLGSGGPALRQPLPNQPHWSEMLKRGTSGRLADAPLRLCGLCVPRVRRPRRTLTHDIKRIESARRAIAGGREGFSLFCGGCRPYDLKG